MKYHKLSIRLAMLSSLAFTPTLQDSAAQRARPKLADVVKIEFPQGGYRFTLEQAAKGVMFPYKIVVTQNFKGVLPKPFGPSFSDPPGASGLFPREQISGNNQVYCLKDFGKGAPRPEKDDQIRTLKKGAYKHSFKWDGRNWTGPSDFGNPKGKPFPAGTYEIQVMFHGKLVTPKGKVPYLITGKTKLVLK